MTIYDLKYEYKKHHPNGHWFDAETLKFFGESLSKMNVLQKTTRIKDSCGNYHECYVVSKLGKDAFGNRRRSYAYFDVQTFDDVIMF